MIHLSFRFFILLWTINTLISEKKYFSGHSTFFVRRGMQKLSVSITCEMFRFRYAIIHLRYKLQYPLFSQIICLTLKLVTRRPSSSFDKASVVGLLLFSSCGGSNLCTRVVHLDRINNTLLHTVCFHVGSSGGSRAKSGLLAFFASAPGAVNYADTRISSIKYELQSPSLRAFCLVSWQGIAVCRFERNALTANYFNDCSFISIRQKLFVVNNTLIVYLF